MMQISPQGNPPPSLITRYGPASLPGVKRVDKQGEILNHCFRNCVDKRLSFDGDAEPPWLTVCHPPETTSKQTSQARIGLKGENVGYGQGFAGPRVKAKQWKILRRKGVTV